MFSSSSLSLIIKFSLVIVLLHFVSSSFYDNNNKNEVEAASAPRRCPHTAVLRQLLDDLERDKRRSDKDMKASIEYQQTAHEHNYHRALHSLHHDLAIVQHSLEISDKNWQKGYYHYFIESGQAWKDFSLYLLQSVSEYIHAEIDYSGGLLGSDFLVFQFFKTHAIVKTMMESFCYLMGAGLVYYYFNVDTRVKVTQEQFNMKTEGMQEENDEDEENEEEDDDEDDATTTKSNEISKSTAAKINLIVNNSTYFSSQKAKAVSVLLIASGLSLQAIIILAAVWDHLSTLLSLSSLAVLVAGSAVVLGLGSFFVGTIGFSFVLPRFLDMMWDAMFSGALMWWPWSQPRKSVVDESRSGLLFVPNRGQWESDDGEVLLNGQGVNNFKRICEELKK